MEKPITLVKQDFVKNLTELVNSSGLPPIILEPIFKDMYNDVKIMANRQISIDTEKWNKFLMETEKGDNDEVS